MTRDNTVACAFCGAVLGSDKACIGFGIEKPVSQSHYFCSNEHRSEYVISETAKERGIEYTIRNVHNNGRTKNCEDELTAEEHAAFEKGEIITYMQDGEELMILYMNPFGELKEY